MEKALSIPEIRIHIGQFLSKRDLKSCVTLSKAWAESLTPWLWRSVTIQSKDSPSLIETVSRYAGHVRTLHLDRVVLNKDQYAHFLSLRTIELSYHSTNSSFQDDITALIGYNRQTLRTLHATDCQKMPITTLRTILESPSLKYLSLSGLVLQEQNLAEELLQTFTRLIRLNLFLSNSSDWSKLCTPTQVFHHLTTLGITTLEHPDHLVFLKACPNLKKLAIALKSTISIKAFTGVLLSSCPKLSMLLYYHEKCESAMEDLNQLVQSLPPMKCLHLNNYYTTIYVATSLFSRHFATLQAIDLENSSDCNGPSIQIILTSCPNLRCISGGTLYSQDIDPQVPWVCLGLEHFGVHTQWYHVEQPMQSPIWSQLSRLTRLCYLTIGVESQPMSLSNPTPFGLDGGLELLAPLKRLTHLDIRGRSLEWQKEEVEWVIQSWPSLCSIHGWIQQDNEKRSELWGRLNSAGIFDRRNDFDFYEYINSL